jgi:hypothetical protein
MKTLSRLAGLLLLGGVTLPAFGLAGDLREPGLAFPGDFPDSARAAITAALRQPGAGFAGGRFINWTTTLRYGGDTQALNRFLDGLVKCPGVAVSVRFQARHLEADSEWTVSHSAEAPGDLTVHVNLQSGRVRLEDLAIPAAKGPPLPPTPPQ